MTMVFSVEAEFLELVEELTDVAVVLDHAVRIDAEAGLARRSPV